MRNAFTYSILLLIAGNIALTACGKKDADDLNEDVPYFQSYQVEYDGSSDSTVTHGSFLEREAYGVSVILDAENYLTVNGNKPKDPIGSKIAHTYTWRGSPIQNVKFELHRKNGKVLTNSINVSDVQPVAFQSGMPTSFSKSSGISFNYVGPPGEVHVTLEGTNSMGEDASHYGAFSANSVNFSSGAVSTFEPGPIKISLKYISSASIQQTDNDAGGAIRLAYKVHDSFLLTP